MTTENTEETGSIGGIPIASLENSTQPAGGEAPIVEEIKEEVKVPEQVVNTDSIVKEFAEPTKEIKKEETNETDFKKEYESKLADYETLKQRESSLNEEIESQRKRFEEIAPKTEKYYKLSRLAETDPDKLPFFEKLLSGTMDEKEILKAKIIEETGISDEKKITAILNKKYGFNLQPLDPDIESDEDIAEREEEISYAEAIREQDSKAFKASKEADLAKIEFPKSKTAADYEQDRKTYLDTWKPLFTEDLSNVKEFNLNVLDEKGTPSEFMKVEIPEAELPEYLKFAANIIGSTNVDATKENSQQVKDLMIKEYFWNNKDRILTDATNKVKKETNDVWRNKTLNPDLNKEKHNEIKSDNSDEGYDNFLNRING